ncbi:MAG: hypothetical protein IKK59_07415 [Lachnospiraceae bacterium]|nr:hypothetical protein [Lachnospiraceae bacterium]
MMKEALTYLKWGFVLLFTSINVGRWDLLPDFLGLYLIWRAFKSQEMTETERRMCPLLIVLIVNRFLHWILEFDNGLENLIITVISTYTIYILVGEIAGRIEAVQPDRTENLKLLRVAFAVLQVLNYLFGAYNISAVIMLLAICLLVVLINLLWVLFKIQPVDVGDEINS